MLKCSLLKLIIKYNLNLHADTFLPRKVPFLLDLQRWTSTPTSNIPETSKTARVETLVMAANFQTSEESSRDSPVNEKVRENPRNEGPCSDLVLDELCNVLE